MYTIYIPKYRGDRPDYNIIRVISKYMSTTSYDCEILAAPGYMNTKAITTDKFYDNIAPVFYESSLSKPREVAIGIFNGVNGTGPKKGTTISLREQHENSIISHGLRLIPLRCKRKGDHRKMLFFMERNKPFAKELTLENYKEFLETVTVRGVMIGSSNQNLTTYYGGLRGGAADKGEADVFMFVEEEVKNIILEEIAANSNIVVSESLSVPGGIDTEYLKSIAEDFLENSLDV